MFSFCYIVDAISGKKVDCKFTFPDVILTGMALLPSCAEKYFPDLLFTSTTFTFDSLSQQAIL